MAEMCEQKTCENIKVFLDIKVGEEYGISLS